MQVRLFSRKQVDIAAASGVEEAGVKVPTSVLLFLYLDPDHDTIGVEFVLLVSYYTLS